MTPCSTRRSDEEWMSLIMESRQSGHTDSEWCRMQGIPISSFYNAVGRLRRKACTIPESAVGKPRQLRDLTSASQDVVPICIEPEETPAPAMTSLKSQAAPHLDNSHSIEILAGRACIRVCNGADPALLSAILSLMRAELC